MNKYLSRVTSSQRGEDFNHLAWPFLNATLAYGVGFAFFLPFNDWLGSSPAFNAMASLGWFFPIAWGLLAILTIVMGLTFLLFNIPPYGKAAGLLGFSLWTFVAMCYLLSGDWLVLAGVAVPNMWFWIWQYLALSVFRREEKEDAATLTAYDAGRYDDITQPKHAKYDREHNRGRDRQVRGAYKNKDDGTDTSRKM